MILSPCLRYGLAAVKSGERRLKNPVLAALNSPTPPSRSRLQRVRTKEDQAERQPEQSPEPVARTDGVEQREAKEQQEDGDVRAECDSLQGCLLEDEGHCTRQQPAYRSHSAVSLEPVHSNRRTAGRARRNFSPGCGKFHQPWWGCPAVRRFLGGFVYASGKGRKIMETTINERARDAAHRRAQRRRVGVSAGSGTATAGTLRRHGREPGVPC